MFDAGRDNSGCGYEETLVDFIYGELDDKERLKFEQHMSSCSSCYNESEALGGVSLKIREWKEDHFDNSVLPNVASAIAAERMKEETAETSKGILGIFAGWQASLAGGMAAVLLLALVGWVILGSDSSGNQIADNKKTDEDIESKSPIEPNEDPVVSTVAKKTDDSEKVDGDVETKPTVEESPVAETPRPVRIVNRTTTAKTKKPARKVIRKRVNKKTPVKKKETPEPKEIESKIERLSPLMAEADDISNDGLSLTDLFEGEVEDDK